MEPIRILITGAAGQIAYSLIPMICKGDVFGSKQPVILHLLDIPPMMEVLKGVVMEIEDCYFPLVKQVIPTDDLEKAYSNIDVAFMLGAMPRKQGMERKDLLVGNVKIFKSQGQALDKWAKKTVKVLVVGNPANTNALVLSKYAQSIPKENITAMTRLDQNRMAGMVAKRLDVSCDQVKNVVVWGNHSATQFPDLTNAYIQSESRKTPVPKALNDDEWIRGAFIKDIQQRGAAVINARKMSSAMSAARAAAEHMKDFYMGTPDGEFVSMGVVSDGSYGIDENLWFSFPVHIKNGKWEIVKGLEIDSFQQSKFDITKNELLEERNEAECVVNE